VAGEIWSFALSYLRYSSPMVRSSGTIDFTFPLEREGPKVFTRLNNADTTAWTRTVSLQRTLPVVFSLTLMILSRFRV
jgi:hypothetical protein